MLYKLSILIYIFALSYDIVKTLGQVKGYLAYIASLQIYPQNFSSGTDPGGEWMASHPP